MLLALSACKPQPPSPPPATATQPPAPSPPPATRPAAPWWQPACAGITPLQIAGDIVPPRVLERVTPTWPTDVRRLKVAGSIIIATVITKEGDVCAATVLRTLDGKPSADLATAALAAIKRRRFQPATRNGVAVPVVYNITINFDLR